MRPLLHQDQPEAVRAIAAQIAELQAGLDDRDASTYNRGFAADVAWGSPYGAMVTGYDELHAIHLRLLAHAAGGPSSRYEVANVLTPAEDVAIAHVRRIALDSDGQPVRKAEAKAGQFSEMAMYVLIRRNGRWWLAAGQNTPIGVAPAPE